MSVRRRSELNHLNTQVTIPQNTTSNIISSVSGRFIGIYGIIFFTALSIGPGNITFVDTLSVTLSQPFFVSSGNGGPLYKIPLLPTNYDPWFITSKGAGFSATATNGTTAVTLTIEVWWLAGQ